MNRTIALGGVCAVEIIAFGCASRLDSPPVLAPPTVVAVSSATHTPNVTPILETLPTVDEGPAPDVAAELA